MLRFARKEAEDGRSVAPNLKMSDKPFNRQRSYRALFYSGIKAGEGGKDLHRTWDTHFRRFLPVERNAEILDAGCGSGGFVAYLHDLGYHRAEGVDINPDAVRRGREAATSDLHHADLRHWLSERPERYRAIVARDVLEHFDKEEIVETVGLIRRGLKENGRLILQTVNAQSPFGLHIRYGDFTHEIAFTASGITSLLTRIGFSRVICHPVRPAAAHSWRAAVRHGLWRPLELLLRLCQAVETGSGEGVFTRNLIAVADK